MKGLVQTPIIIALIIASILIISSYIYTNYKSNPLDKYLKPYPEHGGLESTTTTTLLIITTSSTITSITTTVPPTTTTTTSTTTSSTTTTTTTTTLPTPEYYAEKTKAYITPLSPTVLSKLDALTNNDYRNNSFGYNFDKIYSYACSIRYMYDKDRWGVADYWQTAEQTINLGTGDCEDHAILLQSLAEALLYKTYGHTPNETIYMVCGCIDFNYDGVEEGCHCWNIIDESKIPDIPLSFKSFASYKSTPALLTVVLDDVTINRTKRPEISVTYNTTKDLSKTPLLPLMSIYWQGRKWVELESTWNMPLTYYEDKTYPFLTVWEAFNSKEYYYYPDFIKAGRKPTIFDDLFSFINDIVRQVYNIIRSWS